VKVGGTANPELVPLVREWLGPGSATQIVVGCVSAIDEDGHWARERVRAAVAPYLEVVARRDPTLGLGRGEEPPLDRFTIAGAPRGGRRARARAVGRGRRPRRARHAAGADDAAGIDLICERVLPLLRSG